MTSAALEVLAEQERMLRYPTTFSADEALELGCAVRSLAGDYDLVVWRASLWLKGQGETPLP